MLNSSSKTTPVASVYALFGHGLSQSYAPNFALPFCTQIAGPTLKNAIEFVDSSIDHTGFAGAPIYFAKFRLFSRSSRC